MEEPGTYLWWDPRSGLWNLVWEYGTEEPRVERGVIVGRGVSEVQLLEAETAPPAPTEDVLLQNRAGQGLRRVAGFALPHTATTVASLLLDLDNDGLLDIAGLRQGRPGAANEDPFLAINAGDLVFRTVAAGELVNRDDDLGRADQLIAGFVDGDERPDLFLTHGAGLRPGNSGPYKLALNRMPTSHRALRLELVGRASNRDALGAQVEVRALDGRLLGYREVGSGRHLAQSSPTLHVGLGSHEQEVRVEIRWPGGRRSSYRLPAGRACRIVEPG